MWTDPLTLRGEQTTNLEEVVGGVVQQHDQRPGADVVHTPGEAQQYDGGQVMDYLLVEVLRGRGDRC